MVDDGMLTESFRAAADQARVSARWMKVADHAEALILDELHELRAAREDAYCPGDWICPDCGFIQGMRTMSAQTGNIRASDERALPCPNDGQYLVRLTWKQHAADLRTMLQAELARSAKLIAIIRTAVCREHDGTVNAEPVRYGSKLPACAGGLAFFGGNVSFGPAATFEDALAIALHDGGTV